MSSMRNYTTTGTIISTSKTPPQKMYSCEDHVISQLVAIDIVHSLAYAYSFYIWRIMDIEQPNALAKEVSLQNEMLF